ncbi:MAG: YlxR family protein [Fimbriimonadaceae bacterium]
MGRVPERTCIGCRRKGPASEFLRVFRDSGGRAVVWTRGTSHGRSAYLCPSPRCLEAARKKARLARAWRVPADDPAVAEAFEKLRREIEGRNKQHEHSDR